MTNLDRKDRLQNKVQFVNKLSEAITAGIPGISRVEYAVLEYPDRPNCVEEFAVVIFAGGAKSVRCCTGNSNLANFEEISKLLVGGYYNEVEWFDRLSATLDRIF